ncbi:hypothetical protein M3O57_19565, partial [Xanthomonas nasturtii]|uniref:hypothetical protein n=1 Tax=Xanthomonas nasturtii TaxID=1843581 RepID=UPI002012834A
RGILEPGAPVAADLWCLKGVFQGRLNTLNKLQRLSTITPADCALIDGMMTKYSAFEHSQPTDTPTWLPEPDDLLADVQAMLAWSKDFSQRAEVAVKQKA